MVMRAQYWSPTEGFLLVYSINSRESFEEITTWYQHILRYMDKGCFSLILVANKCDLGSEREVGIHGMFPPVYNLLFFDDYRRFDAVSLTVVIMQREETLQTT